MKSRSHDISIHDFVLLQKKSINQSMLNIYVNLAFHLSYLIPVFVRNIKGDTSLTARLAPCATRLQFQSLATSLQSIYTFLGVARKVNVHASSHTLTNTNNSFFYCNYNSILKYCLYLSYK